MKKILLLFCLIPFLNSFSQEMALSKGTLRITSPVFVDSVTIYNSGDRILRINSIKFRKTEYAYNIDPFMKQTMWKLLGEYGTGEEVIKVLPKRSITIHFKLAASLTKRPIEDYDKSDIIFFYTNSVTSPVRQLKIMNLLGNSSGLR